MTLSQLFDRMRNPKQFTLVSYHDNGDFVAIIKHKRHQKIFKGHNEFEVVRYMAKSLSHLLTLKQDMVINIY